jgi:tRNA pseudouridine55 synthase
MVLRLDKAVGPTSHDVVDLVRRLLHQRKVGHAGTLDPLASGLLLVCTGQATKVAPMLSNLDKTYRARVRLGVATDTGDAEGAAIGEASIPEDLEARLRQALPRFAGEIQQVPPMASAVKVGGQPLYRLRRAGLTVEREPRTVVVRAIDLLGIEPPEVELRVTCGKGTYIRTLAADLAEAAGTRGYLAALRRERIGPFTVEGALSSQEIKGAEPEPVLAAVGMELGQALGHLPAVVLEEDAAYAVRHGVAPRWRDIRALAGALEPGGEARLEGPEGEVLAVVVASGAITEEALAAARAGDGARAGALAPLRFRRVLVGRSSGR